MLQSLAVYPQSAAHTAMTVWSDVMVGYTKRPVIGCMLYNELE
jgi:hypothetical protein